MCLVVNFQVFGQVYPDSNANWCLMRSVWPNGDFFTMVMYDDPDTLINGQVYKRIYDNSFVSGLYNGFEAPVHYVRNAANGKAYSYLFEDGVEYLTADLDAQVGDTVENILVWNEQPNCPNIYNTYALVSVVVDSIIEIWLQGNSYMRHYLSSPCHSYIDENPDLMFWQSGLGTSQGPILAITPGLARVALMCAEVADTMVYSFNGGLCDCVPYNSIDESINPPISILPGILQGNYTIDHRHALAIEVYNSAGALIVQTNGLGFDISQQPPGIYIVRLRGKEYVWSQKIVR